MKVKDILGPSAGLIHYADPDNDCFEMTKHMLDKNVSMLPVVSKDGSLIGVVTSHDVLHQQVYGDMGKTAQDICSKNLITLEPHSLVREASHLMLEKRIHHLVVTDGREIQGILSSLDLLNIPASE